MTAFEIVPEHSQVIVAARSSAGPIHWRGADPGGQVSCELADGVVDLSHRPTGHLLMRIDRLTSGNAVYDAELRRRMDADRFPIATATLDRAEHVGADGRYDLVGRLDLHGVTRSIEGVVTVALRDGRLLVTGEKVLDIRDFDVPAPHTVLLNIYPTVRVQLELEARPV